MAIFLTGDTHTPHDIGKLNTKQMPWQKGLTKEDYLIILGDFGGVWDGGEGDKWWLNWFNDKPFTTLFIPGNHENYDLLYKYPQVGKFEGLVRQIHDSIFMLERGFFYRIDGRTIFALGGAASTDKMWRVEGKSWWPQEVPTQEELDSITERINFWNDAGGPTIDAVLTHCAPTSALPELNAAYRADVMTNYLEYVVKEKLLFKQWFFGHYHQDKVFGKYRCMFDDIIAF